MKFTTRRAVCSSSAPCKYEKICVNFHGLVQEQRCVVCFETCAVIWKIYLAEKSCRNSAAFLNAPSAVRKRSACRCTAPGMWPGRPAPAVAPDGQKRSPANSASERTSRMTGSPLPRMPCSASSDMSCVASASGSGYVDATGSGRSVVQGRPASRQPSRRSACRCAAPAGRRAALRCGRRKTEYHPIAGSAMGNSFYIGLQ